MNPTLPLAARTGRLAPLIVLGAALLGACSDSGQPMGTRDAQGAFPETTRQGFDCVASVADGLRCAPDAASTGGALGVKIGGANGTYILLASSNAGYDAGTGIFSVDVTVQNRMNEAIGSPDGVTPDPEGIRVYFTVDPYATGGGTGEVTVENEDGIAWFTAPNQEFHRYGEILETNEVSSPKTWQFAMPNTTSSFSFKVYVDATVQYKLVINEVMANPVGLVTEEQPREWFELYNAGTLPVDLQNLVISDSAASGRRPYHLISSSLVVAPGAYVVLGGSTNTTTNFGVPVDYAYGTSISLANSLDAVKIARVVGMDTLTLDRTQYSNASVSAQEGISRELKNPALDNSNMDGSNWGSASVTSVYGLGGRGTPKAENSAFTP